jgi:radical SAM superfamily enzyme YgiQ (UPF0313 family)
MGSVRRLRIKLITVPWELEVPTLSLACLAAVTPERHFEVAIVDALRQRLHLDEPVDAVGITASTPAIHVAYAIADRYRARGVPVIFGGHHATAMSREVLEHADAVVVGEGETSWVRILDDLATNPRRVRGVYRDTAPDLRTLPAPSVRHVLLDRYGAYNYPVIASRGCPEVCSFCFSKRMSRGFRTYPIARILEQLRARPAWAKVVYFVDDNLAGDRDFARELFTALRRERTRVPFAMQVRSELADDGEMLRLAYEAGCCFVSSGYESVNQGSLDAQRKGTTAADYRRRIAAVQAEGMIASGNFMFGFDGDDPGTFHRTLDFLDASGMLHGSFTTEIPFPGTASHRKYEREGRLLTRDYARYVGKDQVVVRPAQMSPAELRDGVRRLALAYYGPRRAARRAAAAHANKKIFSGLASTERLAAIIGLSAYQIYQWHYRMTDAGYWLYRRYLPLAKYAYPAEWSATSSFRPLPPGPPAEPVHVHADASEAGLTAEAELG